MEEEVKICDYCGRELAEEEGTPVDDELLCDDCVEEHCVTCDHCGETIWEQNSVSDEDTCLCQDCFDAHYYRCESCGQIVPESIVCWHSDLPYCERCFDEFEDEIEEYGYKPTPIFYGNGKRYFGVELEVDEGGKDNDNAAVLKSIANTHEENIYIKSDGSLEDGFEIVSHPMTLEELCDFFGSFADERIAPSGLCEPTAYDNSTAEKIIVGAIKTDANGLVRAEKFVFTIENGVVTDVEGED